MKSHPAHKRIRLCFFIVIESTGYAGGGSRPKALL